MNIHRISSQIWKWFQWSLNNEKQNFGKWINLLLDGQVRLWEKNQKWWALKAREMFVRSRRKLWPGQVLNRHAKADVPFGVDISCFQKNNDAMVVFFLLDVGTLFGSAGRNKRTWVDRQTSSRHGRWGRTAQWSDRHRWSAQWHSAARGRDLAIHFHRRPRPQTSCACVWLSICM